MFGSPLSIITSITFARCQSFEHHALLMSQDLISGRGRHLHCQEGVRDPQLEGHTAVCRVLDEERRVDAEDL